MSGLSDRRNAIRSRLDTKESSAPYTPAVAGLTTTASPTQTGSSLSSRRDTIKSSMSGRTATPERTDLEQVSRDNQNYQTRLDFEEGEYKDEKSFGKTLKNGALKVLDIIDRPRNAIWNAFKSASTAEKGGEDILKAMSKGFTAGLTGKEKYTGTDLTQDVFGEQKEDANGYEKAGRFLFSLGSEMLADPLNFVTLGAGKAAKGLLTGVGATLSDEAIEGIAKAATSTITPDNILRSTRVAFDNPDALVTAGRISAKEAHALKAVKEFAPDVKDFDALLKSVKFGDTATMKMFTDNGVQDLDKLKRAFTSAEKTLTDFTRKELRDQVIQNSSKYGINPDDITHYTDRLNLKNVMNIEEDVTQPLTEYISGHVLKTAEDAIKSNPKLGGKGLSFGGKTVKTGSELQNAGANVSKMIREYGLNNDGAKAVLSRGFSEFQDSVGTVFSKYFTKGVDAETRKVFKALLSAGESRKGLKDVDVVDKALAFRKTIAGTVDEKFPTLSPKEKIERVELYESGVADFIELGKNKETIERLMLNENPEIVESLALISKEIKKDLANMGISEAQIGKLNSIMDGYLPHVRNTNLSKLTKNEIRELNLARAGEEDDFLDSINRQTGNSGKIVGSDFSSINKSAKLRSYTGTVEEANLMKKLNTSSQGSAAKFVERLQMLKPQLLKDLKKAKIIKVSDGVPRFSTITESPEVLRDLIKRIPDDVWSELDGVENFFETSAIKSYLVRAVQHNKMLTQYETARDVLNAVGTHIGKKDLRMVKDMQAKGYDIVITRGYFENINAQQLQELAEASSEKLGFLQNIIRKSTDNKEAMRTLSNSEVEQLMDIMDTTRIPMEIFAVPAAIRKTYNDIASKQIDAGFKTIGDTVDSLHRMWKPLVTGYRPDFHARNYISSTLNDFLDNGTKSFNPKYKMMAGKIKHGSTETVEIAGETFTGDQLYRIMKEQGALSNMTRDLSQDTLDETLRLKMKSSGKSILEKATNAYEKGGHLVGNKIEDNLRATNFVINMERGLENGLDVPRAVQYAVEKVNQFHFDYSDLSNVERKLLRRVMPFYTWARKNIPLQLEQFLDNPAVYGKVGDIVTQSAEANDVDLENMATWAQGTLPITTPFKDDSGRNILISGLFPQADLGNIADSPKDFMTEQLAGMTPILKAPLEMTLNKSILTGAPIYRTEAEKNSKLLQYALGQTGFLKDATNTITGQASSSGEFSGINAPLGIGKSLIKKYDADKASYNRGMEYNRYLADVVQGYKNTGNPISTLADIKDLEETLIKQYGSNSSGGTLFERRRTLGGK